MRLTPSQWQLLVIQQEVLEREERPELVGGQGAVPQAEQEEQIVTMSTVPGTQVIEGPTVEDEEEPLALVPQEPDDLDDETENDDVEDEEEDDIPQVRRSTRTAGGVRKSDRYAMITKLNKETEKDENR